MLTRIRGWLRALLPKRWRTIIILQIMLSLACAGYFRARAYDRVHPFFFHYFLYAKDVEVAKDGFTYPRAYGHEIVEFEVKPGQIMIYDDRLGRGNWVNFLEADPEWLTALRAWIWIKKVCGIDLGSAY